MRYFNLKTYLTQRFGTRVARISLDAGLTCPNRDGTLSTQGCLFCDAKGSGTGAAGQGLGPAGQIEAALAKSGKRANKFIAYFQSFTNTYAPASRLKSMWDQAMSFEDIVGLAIGTRPDCLPDDVLDLLAQCSRDKEVWLELGLQSASDQTLTLINRGHTAYDFARAARRAQARGLKVLAHVILGLPGEGEKEMLATAGFISDLGLSGVKVHSLYVSRDAGLAEMYARGKIRCLTQEEFVRLAVLFLEHIPPDMVVHRLTGDPDPATLLAPDWALDKQRTLNLIRERLKGLETWQGRRHSAARLAASHPCQRQASPTR